MENSSVSPPGVTGRLQVVTLSSRLIESSSSPIGSVRYIRGSKLFDALGRYVRGTKLFDSTRRYVRGTKLFDSSRRYGEELNYRLLRKICRGTKLFDSSGRYVRATKLFDSSRRYVRGTKLFVPRYESKNLVPLTYLTEESNDLVLVTYLREESNNSIILTYLTEESNNLVPLTYLPDESNNLVPLTYFREELYNLVPLKYIPEESNNLVPPCTSMYLLLQSMYLLESCEIKVTGMNPIDAIHCRKQLPSNDSSKNYLCRSGKGLARDVLDVTHSTGNPAVDAADIFLRSSEGADDFFPRKELHAPQKRYGETAKPDINFCGIVYFKSTILVLLVILLCCSAVSESKDTGSSVEVPLPTQNCENDLPECQCADFGVVAGFTCLNMSDFEKFTQKLTDGTLFEVNTTYEITLSGNKVLPRGFLKGLIVFRLYIDDPDTEVLEENAFEGGDPAQTIPCENKFHIESSRFPDNPGLCAQHQHRQQPADIPKRKVRGAGHFPGYGRGDDLRHFSQQVDVPPAQFVQAVVESQEGGALLQPTVACRSALPVYKSHVHLLRPQQPDGSGLGSAPPHAQHRDTATVQQSLPPGDRELVQR
ncbi:uncharacterized protein CEXT_722621 [Caerostris extrusa]|uniref:Uncharacterized protein n=1 Tax=Caerostris extrusa TaxID=172846 RepID=A0AAV4VHV1_CAEEX|nr:uncharacterized protein CEXT_722621 [Caerostris extrusa]